MDLTSSLLYLSENHILKPKKKGLCVKWAKLIVTSNNITIFTIAAKLSKFIYDGDPPMKLKMWILLFLWWDRFRPVLN